MTAGIDKKATNKQGGKAFSSAALSRGHRPFAVAFVARVSRFTSLLLREPEKPPTPPPVMRSFDLGCDAAPAALGCEAAAGPAPRRSTPSTAKQMIAQMIASGENI